MCRHPLPYRSEYPIFGGITSRKDWINIQRFYNPEKRLRGKEKVNSVVKAVRSSPRSEFEINIKYYVYYVGTELDRIVCMCVLLYLARILGDEHLPYHCT